MSREEICKELAEIIGTDLGISADTIFESSKLMEELGASSFDIMILLPRIEETFKIEFSVRALREMITVGDFEIYLRNSVDDII